jgi:pimeloyl-ACP methyl ester carboxylesterase
MDDATELNVRSGDVRICTQAFGRSGDPGMVLIMGATASMIWWPDEMCRRLADSGFQAVRYDNRDTGGSTTQSPGLATYSVEDLVADLWAVQHAYGFERAHLVGMSLGGLVAQIASVTFPERVASMTLIGSEPLGGSENELPGIDQRFMAHFATMGDLDWSDDRAVTDFLLEIARLSAGTPDTFDLRPASARIASELERTDSIQSAFNHATLELHHDWSGRLSEVTAPTLVIHGERDPILPLANGRSIAEQITSARLHVLHGVGHELPIEAIDEICAAITEHAGR